jgi:Fe2+ transport system protein FeoA
MVDNVVPLESLLPGQSARVARITGRSGDVHRLEEFGLRGGTRLRMFRQGSPCIVRVAGGKICLRPRDRVSILVEPVDG